MNRLNRPVLDAAGILAAHHTARDAQIRALIRKSLGRTARAERLIADVLGTVHYHDQLGEETT
jgi:hypothetical protein